MAKKVLDVKPPVKTSKKSGLASFFDMSSFFEDTSKAYGDMTFTEVKKLVSHLDQAANNLCMIYGVSFTLAAWRLYLSLFPPSQEKKGRQSLKGSI